MGRGEGAVATLVARVGRRSSKPSPAVAEVWYKPQQSDRQELHDAARSLSAGIWTEEQQLELEQQVSAEIRPDSDQATRYDHFKVAAGRLLARRVITREDTDWVRTSTGSHPAVLHGIKLRGTKQRGQIEEVLADIIARDWRRVQDPKYDCGWWNMALKHELHQRGLRD